MNFIHLIQTLVEMYVGALDGRLSHSYSQTSPLCVNGCRSKFVVSVGHALTSKAASHVTHTHDASAPPPPYRKRNNNHKKLLPSLQNKCKLSTNSSTELVQS